MGLVITFHLRDRMPDEPIGSAPTIEQLPPDPESAALGYPHELGLPILEWGNDLWWLVGWFSDNLPRMRDRQDISYIITSNDIRSLRDALLNALRPGDRTAQMTFRMLPKPGLDSMYVNHVAQACAQLNELLSIVDDVNDVVTIRIDG